MSPRTGILSDTSDAFDDEEEIVIDDQYPPHFPDGYDFDDDDEENYRDIEDEDYWGFGNA